MRTTLLAAICAAFLLAAPAATAAPTCQDRRGDTVRCGTERAMPVGWTLPPAERLERMKTEPAGPNPATYAGLIAFLIGFFALIALMPDFDGQWDGQEEDEEEQG
jgi:hypothetical protein